MINLLKNQKKYIYLNNKKNIIGIDIKAEFPKQPHIVVNNDFKRSIKDLSNEVIKKIKEII